MEGWVNFEKEISRVIQSVDSIRKTKKIAMNPITGDYYSEIEKCAYNTIYAESVDDEAGTTFKNIQSLKNRLLTDLNRTIRALEIYLACYVENVQMEQVNTYLKNISELDIDGIISFNYTNTYGRLYEKTGNKNKIIMYDYIHGFSKETGNVDTCNMVLGIDEYLDEPEKSANNQFIEFKKFYQRIYKRTGCFYKLWLGNREKTDQGENYSGGSLNHIYFYGHSMDVTDGDIIKDLICRKDTITTVFYHSREALGGYISNLVKILKEDTLVEMTSEYNRKLLFEPINKEDEYELVNSKGKKSPENKL